MTKNMIVKEIVRERFTDYCKPHLLIAMPTCDFKCWREMKTEKSNFCINCHLAKLPNIEVSISSIIDMFVSNPITEAIVIGGLEPFDSFDDIYQFIGEFRTLSEADIVIYTGYYKYEIKTKINSLLKYKNIIIKFGRYLPEQEPKFDPILGIILISGNQYAEKIS